MIAAATVITAVGVVVIDAVALLHALNMILPSMSNPPTSSFVVVTAVATIGAA